ncbi:MAG TPA: TetR/AcrR family transcriptional regulator [Caulobacteraceae bacterium]|nr:TetR/AcrR family transcriptional regulator [Caulobacteraceae bacterium]
MPKAKTAEQALQGPATSRVNNPEKTKAEILEVAFKEFADNGYGGARVDEIAARTSTSKRMIYYYFESKDGLYQAVLREYYLRLRGAERTLHLEDKRPLDALAELVSFTFDYHTTHPDGVRLIIVENIQNGRTVSQLPNVEGLNSVIIHSVRDICERGASEGVIRPNIDPVDLYQTIAALSFFNVTNKYTFAKIFQRDMTSPEALAARKASVVETILRFVAA